MWEEFASMKEKRYQAAGVVYNKKLHVFGGQIASAILQSSETIDVNGEVSDGPDLPTGVWVHALTKINDTVSLLSGGVTNADGYFKGTALRIHNRTYALYPAGKVFAFQMTRCYVSFLALTD